MQEIFDKHCCIIAENTDVGCKRSVNEDWMIHFDSPNGLVAIVCDGMGGHVGGKIASHTAIEAIRQFMMRESTLSSQEIIVEAIKNANDAVLYKASQQPELKGMGATCVMLLVRKNKVYIGSVGDSRVYHNRAHILHQLTKDQSFVQTLVDAGAITPEQAEKHPRKNEITNAIGLPNMQPATVLPEPIVPEAGDCFLLCSDGLSGMVSDNEIKKVVSRKSDMTLQARVDELILRAKHNGGLDNITCQLVEFPISPKTQTKLWKRKCVVLTMIPLFILSLCICGWLVYKHDGKENKQKKEHSETIEKLISTVDSTCYLKPLIFKKNYKFLELCEHKGLGIDIRQYLQNGQDTTIHLAEPDLSISELEIYPEKQVNITFAPGRARCYLTLKDEFKDEQEVSIILRSKSKKGLSYQFLIKIDTKDETAPMTQQPGEKTSKSRSIVEKVYSDGNEEGKDQQQNWSNPDCTVPVSKLPFVLCINPQSKSQYDCSLFYDVAIPTDKNLVEGLDWVEVRSNNGRTCFLYISKVPDDAKIRIPVKGTDARGESLNEIIIRFNLQN